MGMHELQVCMYVCIMGTIWAYYGYYLSTCTVSMGIMGTIWLYVQYNEYGHTISRGI